MPFQKKQYVRFWDGSGVVYGQVVDVLENQKYSVRIGGTDRTRTVEESKLALHPALVASGMLLGDWGKFRRNPNVNRYMYHVSAYENLGSVVMQKGLRPRSQVDWSQMGGDVYTGADFANGRLDDVNVDLREYLESPKWDSYHLGDIGEFFYASPKADTSWGYLEEVAKSKKTAIVLRFKPPGNVVWYQDPRSGGVMTMGRIPLAACEIMLVQAGKLSKAVSEHDFGLEDEIMSDVETDGDHWISCSSSEWKSAIDSLYLKSRFSMLL